MPYTRRRIKSMTDIDREQERIKKLSRNLEKNWNEGLLDQGFLFSTAMSLFSSKKEGRNGGQSIPGMISSFFTGKKKKYKTKKQTGSGAEGSAKAVTKVSPKVKKALRAIGISFLRWQAFNLVWFLGKKAYQAVDKRADTKKQERRLHRDIRKMEARLAAAADKQQISAKKLSAAL